MKGESRLSLVQTNQAFPELPDQKMSTAPGALKGDPQNKNTGVPPDDPANYTGSFAALYDYKMQLKALYLTDTVQLIVAGVIFANFIVVMFSVTQYVLDNPDVDDKLEILDKIFIWFFVVELFINMFTSAQGTTVDASGQSCGTPTLISPWFWQWEFWVGDNWAWNWFDFIVIMVPLTMSGLSFASSIRILRLFRVIRVLKSIAKFEALQVVASSVSASVGGVGAVALMIFGLMCCYAIVGVVFFGRKEFNEACAKSEKWDLHMVKLQPPVYAAEVGDEICDPKNYPDKKCKYITYKAWAHMDGFENTIQQGCGDYEALYDCFANLRRALYTTFMMMTLESWPDLCWASVTAYKYGAAYFVSFVAINALMMANLIIAVFTTRMDAVEDQVKADAAAYNDRRRQMSAAVFDKMGDNATIQGVDLDGDGIADEFVIDADGDGIADVVLSKDEMAQIWTVGEPIQVYSHTIMQWCNGQVKEVNHKDKRIKVEYDVDGNTLGEKTIPFKHDSIRRPAGAAIGGSAVQVVSGKSTLGTAAQGGGRGNIENMGELTNILNNFQKKLDQIAQKVDNLVSEKSQKGRI